MKINKSHIIYFTFVLFSIQSISAQSKLTDPLTFNASSGTYKNLFEVIDWNFGEVFTNSFSDKEKLLITSGFLQSKSIEKLVKPITDSTQFLDKNSNYLTLSPTLVTDLVYINNKQALFKIVEVLIYDINGKMIKIVDEPFSTPVFTKSISLQNLTSGSYIMMISYIINQKYYRVKLFKFIKM